MGFNDKRPFSFGQLVVGYLAIMAAVIALSIAFERLGGLPAERTSFLAFGGLFIVASTRSSRYLFELVRNTGWFSLVPSDRVMQVVLAVIGGLLCMLGLSYSPV